MDQELKIDVFAKGSLPVLRLTGFFAHMEVLRLKNKIESLIERGQKHVVLNLSGCSFIDSAGLGALFQAHKACTQAGGSLVLVSPLTSHARQAMAIAAMDKMIPTHDSEEEACKAMAQQCGLSLAAVDASATQRIGVMPARPRPVAPRGDHDSAGEIMTMMCELLAQMGSIEGRLSTIEQRLTFRTPTEAN